MGPILVYMIIGLFAALLFLQLYFRLRVITVYRRLVKNEIEFDSSHLFNKKKMAEEVLPRYPKHREDILTFASHIKFSVIIACVFVVLITLAGVIMRGL